MTLKAVNLWVAASGDPSQKGLWFSMSPAKPGCSVCKPKGRVQQTPTAGGTVPASALLTHHSMICWGFWKTRPDHCLYLDRIGQSHLPLMVEPLLKTPAGVSLLPARCSEPVSIGSLRPCFPPAVRNRRFLPSGRLAPLGRSEEKMPGSLIAPRLTAAPW